jgi:predicted transcriptional regulator
VHFTALIHKKLVNPSQIQVTDKKEERRVLSSIPCLLSITEKQALVSFLPMDKKISTSRFFGNDSSFIRWVNDLFT